MPPVYRKPTGGLLGFIMDNEDDDLEEARMALASAVWRIAALAGHDTVVEDLTALLHIIQAGGLEAMNEVIQ